VSPIDSVVIAKFAVDGTLLQKHHKVAKSFKLLIKIFMKFITVQAAEGDLENPVVAY